VLSKKSLKKALHKLALKEEKDFSAEFAKSRKYVL